MAHQRGPATQELQAATGLHVMHRARQCKKLAPLLQGKAGTDQRTAFFGGFDHQSAKR